MKTKEYIEVEWGAAVEEIKGPKGEKVYFLNLWQKEVGTERAATTTALQRVRLQEEEFETIVEYVEKAQTEIRRLRTLALN